MNSWITSKEIHDSCLKLAGIFLQENVEMPALVMNDGVKLIGFADECTARQSNVFYKQFIKFMSLIEESNFYFIWLPDGLKPFDYDNEYPIYFCDSIPVEGKDFVRLQSNDDEEAFYSNAWILLSSSKNWAIYGEQYGSEMAILLSRDNLSTNAMLSSFPELIREPQEALISIANQYCSEESASFENEFLKNYLIQE